MFKLAGGSQGIAIMQDYFPLMIDTGSNTSIAENIQDIIFLDRNGVKVDEEVANAVLNGLEIDTTSYREES